MLTLLLLALALPAEVPARTGPDFEAILDLAQGVPGEFGAQAILRVVESGAVADKSQARKLIESAFEKASSAREPAPRRPLPAFRDDGLVSLRSSAYASGLDRLSLETRAVRDMARLDPKRAAALFERVAYPSVRWRDCKEPLYEDVSPYFTTLVTVLPSSKDGDKLALAALSRLQSPAELAPAEQMVRSLPLDPDARAAVEGSFAAIRERIGPLSCPNAPPPNTVSLSGGVIQPPSQPRPEIEALRARWMSLASSDAGRMPSEETKNTPEWRGAFDQLLSDIDALQLPPETSEQEVLETKCGLLGLMYMASPAGRERDALLGRYLSVLLSSPLQQEDPVFWYTRLDAFALAARSNDPAQRDAFLSSLESTANPVVALYARLERILPAF